MNGIKAGELVFYPLHGVGLLQEEVKCLYEEKEIVYFKVHFEKNKLDILIPADSAYRYGIRPLTSPKMLERSVCNFFNIYKKLPVSSSYRKKTLDKKLRSGKILCVIEIIRDLVCAPKYGLKLGFQDKSMLEAARNLLVGELMYVLNLTIEEASDTVNKMIRKQQKL